MKTIVTEIEVPDDFSPDTHFIDAQYGLIGFSSFVAVPRLSICILAATPPQAPAVHEVFPATLAQQILDDLQIRANCKPKSDGCLDLSSFLVNRLCDIAAAPAAPEPMERQSLGTGYTGWRRAIREISEETQSDHAPADDESRAAFERWWLDQGNMPFSLNRAGSGYALNQAYDTWVGWQACARTLYTSNPDHGDE